VESDLTPTKFMAFYSIHFYRRRKKWNRNLAVGYLVGLKFNSSFPKSNPRLSRRLSALICRRWWHIFINSNPESISMQLCEIDTNSALINSDMKTRWYCFPIDMIIGRFHEFFIGLSILYNDWLNFPCYKFVLIN
jgi:hypothetical protein